MVVTVAWASLGVATTSTPVTPCATVAVYPVVEDAKAGDSSTVFRSAPCVSASALRVESYEVVQAVVVWVVTVPSGAVTFTSIWFVVAARVTWWPATCALRRPG